MESLGNLQFEIDRKTFTKSKLAWLFGRASQSVWGHIKPVSSTYSTTTPVLYEQS